MHEEAKKLIKKFEGCRLTAYKCPAGIWTIGYGYTHGIHEGMSITQDQADILLDEEIDNVAKQVSSVVKVPLTSNQEDALIDFAYNLGIGNLKSSTLLKKLNVSDFAGAADEFDKWIYASGKVLPGLVKRRQAEKELFLS